MTTDHSLERYTPPAAPIPAWQPIPAPVTIDLEAQESATPLSHYLWVLRRQRWKILPFVLACMIATLIVSKRLTPIFESTVTVDIDRHIPAGVVGQDAAQSTVNDADQFLATQIKLIQSDAVLRPVAEQFHLRDAATALADPMRAEQAPVTLRNLKVSRPPNTYLLLIGYRSADPELAANAANAIARSYVEHTYNIRFRSSASLSTFMEKQLEELRAKMERSSEALAQFEKELNVINPAEKTNILSARLLQLNTDYTAAQTERVKQEAAFESVSGGTMESAQASSQGEELKKIEERLGDAREKFAQAQAHYGVNHPEYHKAQTQLQEVAHQFEEAKANVMRRVEVEYREALNREAMLKKAVAETKGEFDALNARSFRYDELKREAEADKRLYEELETKIKEAEINSGFQNSAIRIADSARPALLPVFPNLKLNLALALLFSLLLATSAALVADVLDRTVRDPEQVVRTLNTHVVGSLPGVKEARASNGSALLLARPSDGAVSGYDEAVRTLRNSILLADFDRRLRTVMITSAAPSEGKSTIATNLAVAHAQQGHKTLLIDGDLRRPSVHRRLDLPGTVGLSDALTSGLAWRETISHLEGAPSLDVLLAGPPSRRACDQIGVGLAEILEDARKDYDLIIIDSPPLLGFPEPLQMSALVDGVLLVARSGQTNRKALASAIATLNRLRANVIGIVMNEVRADTSDSYYYHYYHPKYYGKYKAA
ncbi:MAG: polysaccharide biosynthesis tyrosine autokinase [Bryobacteraceae bacterium]|jgi:polysaccharide biosynthesis transport protein